MNDPIGNAAANLVGLLALGRGSNLDPETLVRLAGEVLQAAAEVLDSHAKRHAEAAGDAAAAKITSEPQAEAELRKK